MTRLTDKPMARAANHLAAGRYPQAIGAYRAVIGIDASEYQAHVGIAEAEAGRGNQSVAVDALLEAAAAYAGDENHVAALALFGHALGMDPVRLEVHLDVAICESAAGHHEAAIERCEALASMYIRAGRSDEAEEIFRFVANWEPGEPSIHSAPISVGVSTTGPIALSSLAQVRQGPAPTDPLSFAPAPMQPAFQPPPPYGMAPAPPAPPFVPSPPEPGAPPQSFAAPVAEPAAPVPVPAAPVPVPAAPVPVPAAPEPQYLAPAPSVQVTGAAAGLGAPPQPPAAAPAPPAPADPWEQWSDDPRADPGGTAVFRIPEDFYERIDKTMVAPIPEGLIPGGARSVAPTERPLAAPIVGGVAPSPPPPAPAPAPAPARAPAPIPAPPLASSLLGRPQAPPPASRASSIPRTVPAPGRSSLPPIAGRAAPKNDAPKSGTTRFTAVPSPIKQAPVTRSAKHPALATPRASAVKTTTTKHAPLPAARPSAAPQVKTGSSPRLAKSSSSLVDRLRRRAGLDESTKAAAKPTKPSNKAPAPSPASEPHDEQTIRRPKQGAKPAIKRKDAIDGLQIPSPAMDAMATAIHKGSPVKRREIPEEVTVRRLATDGAPVEDDQATQIFQTNGSDEAASS